MLALRLRDGLPSADLDDGATGGGAAGRRGWPARNGRALAAGRAVLSFRGRLLADAVVRAMVGVVRKLATASCCRCGGRRLLGHGGRQCGDGRATGGPSRPDGVRRDGTTAADLPARRGSRQRRAAADRRRAWPIGPAARGEHRRAWSTTGSRRCSRRTRARRRRTATIAVPADDRHVEGVPICWFDLPQMRRLGYDNIRLNVSWSLLEPRPGHIDHRYIARIAQVVGWAKRQGIWVDDRHAPGRLEQVRLHAARREVPAAARRHRRVRRRSAVGNDFAAAGLHRQQHPRAGPRGDRQTRRRSGPTCPAPDGVGLQEHYAHVLAVLAKRFADDPAVAGYDLMNEPEPGAAAEAENTAELLPFYAKVARTILAAVPSFRQLLFFEPGVERNTTAQRAFFTPWSSVSSYPNAVYAPHVYTDVFTLGAVAGTPEIATFASDYARGGRRCEGAGPPAVGRGVRRLAGRPTGPCSTALRAAGEARIGGTMWLWKENANDTAPTRSGASTVRRSRGRSVRGVAAAEAGAPYLARLSGADRRDAAALRRAIRSPAARELVATSSPCRGRRPIACDADRGACGISRARSRFEARTMTCNGAGPDREVWLYPRRRRFDTPA